MAGSLTAIGMSQPHILGSYLCKYSLLRNSRILIPLIPIPNIDSDSPDRLCQSSNPLSPLWISKAPYCKSPRDRASTPVSCSLTAVWFFYAPCCSNPRKMGRSSLALYLWNIQNRRSSSLACLGIMQDRNRLVKDCFLILDDVQTTAASQLARTLLRNDNLHVSCR